MTKRKVLLVGWDAADWKLIDKLMDAGLMPAMQRLVNSGVRGKIATLDPPLSPMLWTSMATGVRPFKHGVSGFVESDGHGGVRPVTSYGRKVNAFWNIFTKEGLKSNVIGWWPSNPVESINGVMVSNNFQQERKGRDVIPSENWEIPPGTIYPESFIDRLKEYRIHPDEITGNLVMPFVPRALETDQKKDPRLSIIARFLAHSASLHAVTTDLMESTDWDITAVYHDALDHFCHGFMKFHPPRMEGLDEDMFELYKDVVKGAYVYHDMMLDRLLNLITDDTTVILVSDHGFHSDHLRPKYIPKVPSGPAVEHAPYGVFVARGPGIKKGEVIHGASILDVTPTLLSLFDLPIGKDMDGKPLMSIYDHPKEISYIDSWENDKRFGGELVVPETEDRTNSDAALQQLIDLGYIDETLVPTGEDADEAKRKKLRDVVRENSFYMAKSYLAGGYFDEALEILLEIEDRDNPDFRYLLEIVNISVKTRRFALAQEYLTFIKSKELMNSDYIKVLEAQVKIGLNEPGEALVLLKEAAKTFTGSPQVLLDLGKLLNALWETNEARKVFKRIVELDPNNPYALNGIGTTLLREERYEEALEYFLGAVEIQFHYIQAHINIGEALVHLKDFQGAIKSFELVTALSPKAVRPYRWLRDLHEILENESDVVKYQGILNKIEKGTKVIVTGMPSQRLFNVIQILKGKVDVYNSDDPALLEFKNEFESSDWITKIQQDVLFVPVGLVSDLPTRYSYRILYVVASAEESMEYMLKQSKLRSNSYSPELFELLTKKERISRLWINQQPLLDINYLFDENDLTDSLMINFMELNKLT